MESAIYLQFLCGFKQLIGWRDAFIHKTSEDLEDVRMTENSNSCYKHAEEGPKFFVIMIIILK